MKTFIFLGGVRFSIDSRRTFTHCVLTRETKVEPRGRSMTPKEIREHEEAEKIHDELSVFAREEVAGRFALKPADWATSEEEANNMANHYHGDLLEDGKTSKWSEVVVKPIDGTLDHA